jgi:hypothetical protein
VGAELFELLTFQVDSDAQFCLVSTEEIDSANQQDSDANSDKCGELQFHFLSIASCYDLPR